MLVVDDDPQILRAVRTSLQGHSYEVLTAGNGETALDLLPDADVDLIVLDLGLPGIGGHEVIRRVRSWSDVPIIVLSVRDGQRDKVDAFEAGADDYVTKPFGMPELLARMRAVRRRAEGDRRPPVVRFGDLEVDLGRQLVKVGGSPIHLTPTEYRLLEAFVTNPGQAPDPPVAPPAGLGAGVRHGAPVPPGVHPPAPEQARGRPGASPVHRHRSRPRLSMEARSRRGSAPPYRDAMPIIEIQALPPAGGIDVSAALAQVTSRGRRVPRRGAAGDVGDLAPGGARERTRRAPTRPPRSPAEPIPRSSTCSPAAATTRPSSSGRSGAPSSRPSASTTATSSSASRRRTRTRVLGRLSAYTSHVS